MLTSGFHSWHDWHLQSREYLIRGRDGETIDFSYDLRELRRTLDSCSGRVAAVFVTPEPTYFPIPYFQELEKIVRDHGVLLMYDEVMAGLRYGQGGFHGTIGSQPDVVTVSKGLANGIALSAVIGSDRVLAAQDETYLGNTYMRDVVPFVVSQLTLPELTYEGGIARMQAAGTRLMEGLNTAFAEHGIRALALGPRTAV